MTQDLSERRALTVVRMSAATLRYVPRPDPDPGRWGSPFSCDHRLERLDV